MKNIEKIYILLFTSFNQSVKIVLVIGLDKLIIRGQNRGLIFKPLAEATGKSGANFAS